jgi:hypothetical protein
VSLLDLVAFFDPIDRLEGLICTFYFADWKNAQGPWGLLRELLSVATGRSAPIIEFRRGEWSGLEVEKLLARHGVKVFDRGMATSDTLYFRVKRRQLGWAEYLLARAGVPILTAHNPRLIAAGRRARANGLGEPPARPQSRWFAIQSLASTLTIGGGAVILLSVAVFFCLR